MLSLREIKKDYTTASEVVHALRGVSVAFRKSEFVSILGPSGCGKTTLLNIVGGLDHYSDGDLVINGRSTKSYTDRDWDVYRNHRIGFIFQSYNLIPHQTVLANVELALTIAGIDREERVRRAKRALDRVGLSNQYNKRPNQLSGGQCQRVAIARALVNDPEILLADEPTGALDTTTSVQIMELIKEISKERLVIMVTHNPELAEEYSSRIIKLRDGEIIEDNNPFSLEEEEAECERLATTPEALGIDGFAYDTWSKTTNGKLKKVWKPADKKKAKKQRRGKKAEKAKMSFFTAFKLSLKNLFTKKGRTTLTAFAGSIGIIGIALILAVSQGMTMYINHVQETTLSAYPLTLESTTLDASALIESLMSKGDEKPKHENDAIYKDPLIAELVDALSKVEANENDLTSFKAHIEAQLADPNSPLSSAVMGIQYSYDLELPIYTVGTDGNIIKSDKGKLISEMLAEFMMGLAQSGSSLAGPNAGAGGAASSGMSNAMAGSILGVKLWEELLAGGVDESGNKVLVNDILKSQYDLIDGDWPKAANEIVLVVNANNELDDLTLYALGLLSEAEIDAIIDAAVNGTTLPEDNSRWTYEQIRGLKFKTILPSDFYVKNVDGTYKHAGDDKLLLNTLYGDAYELTVTGIIRPNPDAETTMLSGSIGYTTALTEYVIQHSLESEVVKAQLANPDYDILTGLPFKEASGKLSPEEKKAQFLAYVENLTDAEKAAVYVEIQCLAAIEQNLDTRVNMMLGMFKDKDSAIAMINQNLTQSGIDPSSVSAYFEKLTLDEIKELLRPTVEEMISEQIAAATAKALEAMPEAAKIAALTQALTAATTEQFTTYYDEITKFSDSKYDDVLVEIGCLDLDSPSRINIFASSFANKDIIEAEIDKYNDSVSDDKKIAYTDIIGIMMSSITIIIDAIKYVLIAFVSISLVVSSIMIGVITLISVQERTKEIGVLRAIGASKKDVSSMFNAETIIIGLASGLLGVTVTYLLCIPINLILNALTGIPNLKAVLPVGAAVILVLISVILTLISGLIPSKSAAKKDPVVALRTE